MGLDLNCLTLLRMRHEVSGLYQPPRDLAEIDADLDKVSAEIMGLLTEVHS